MHIFHTIAELRQWRKTVANIAFVPTMGNLHDGHLALVERAKQESQFKSTIAHGYLTLSLLPHLWEQIIEVNNIKMLVNYGMDKMRFGQAVVTGSRVRLVTKLHAISNIRGICKTEIEFKIEIEGQRKPALEGIATFLYYFE